MYLPLTKRCYMYLPLTNDYSFSGRGRLKRLILPFLLFLKLKFSVLVPIAISVATLLAFKGLWAGLSALMITGALGLKALFSNNDGKGYPSTRFSLGFVRPHIVPEIYHGDYVGWSRSVPIAEHGYRSEPYYRVEHPYREYYPPSWDRPHVAAAK
jgi:hypothetical protein